MLLSLGTKHAGWPAVTGVGRVWQSLHDRYARMAKAARLRRELDRMDARMLSDIGVSRAQLAFDIDRWERGGR